ncbi:MAG: N-acetylmuramoyl-L-alanine amidase [Ferruginibacter sp.]
MLLFSYYLLKVIICSAVLYTYYWFFLRNKIFHSYNRFYLLATIVLSLILPLVKVNIWQKADAPKIAVVKMLQVVNSSDEYMDEIIIQSHYNHVSKETIALWIFIAICFAFAVVFIKAMLNIYALKRNNPQHHFDGINLIQTSDKKTPFSFFKNIFWNNEIDINSENGKRILKHEVAHVQEKHSHDKLFINIVLIFFWMNPIFWLLRKELNMIHEFIADKKAVEDGDTSAFAAMILHATYPTHRFELANNFFYSPIKRRIAMITKNKSKVSYISRLLVLPLTIIVFAAFTLKAKTYINSLPGNDKTITVVIDAGHGGKDNGAIATDGTLEKDLTLYLAKKIQELNRSENIKIILTRETDIYQEPKEKAGLANKFNADLFISLHVDNAPAAGDEKQTGMSVFVARDEFKNTASSKLFATSIISAFHNNYLLRVPVNPSQTKRGITVLEHTTCPSVLIEAGFVSNKNDLAYLKSTDAQEQFAKNILSAIATYVQTTGNNKASITVPQKTTSQVFKGTENTAFQNDTAPDFKPLLQKIKEDVSIDASHVVIVNDKEETFYTLTGFSHSKKLPQPLIIINGEESTIKKLNEIGKEKFEHIRLLTAETATAIYGEKGNQGAVIVNVKTNYNLSTHATDYDFDHTYFMVGDLTSSNIPAAEFKKQKTITVRAGLKFVSATVFFGGAGFEYPEETTLTGTSLSFIKAFIEKSVSGTSITFDNIKVQDDEGHNFFIQSKSYNLRDKNIDPTLPTINLSGISSPRINISGLSTIKELKCSDENYDIVGVTVFFSEKGFPNVKMAYMNDGSLKVLEDDMHKIVAGSRITFDNIHIAKKDGSGKMQIEGRSFLFYDPKIPDADPDTLKNNVFMKVEQEPEFPGGKDAWQEYLRKNLDPKIPINEGWKPGTYRIVVNFIVDREGNVSNVSSDDFINTKTALSCIKLIQNGPKWIPAKQNGKIVKAYRKQPITFVVSEN